jgi:hypothetical protein
MQRCVAALFAVALGTGCTSRTGGTIGTLAGVGITSIGITMRMGAFGPGGDTDPEDVAFIPLTVGLVILIPSLYVYLTAKDQDEAAKPVAPPKDPRAEHRAADREQAWQLTKQAMAASRTGDCPTAVQLAPEVKALDADFYETVFERDAGIARCLKAATLHAD